MSTVVSTVLPVSCIEVTFIYCLLCPIFCLFSFPEIQFYHSEEVREMMVDVLFCFCREHEALSYRQVCEALELNLFNGRAKQRFEMGRTGDTVRVVGLWLFWMAVSINLCSKLTSDFGKLQWKLISMIILKCRCPRNIFPVPGFIVYGVICPWTYVSVAEVLDHLQW